MRKLSYIAILLLCQLSAIAQTAETKYTLTIQSEPENSFYLRYSIYRPNQSEGGYWDSSDNSQPSWKLKVAPGQQVKLTATLRDGFKFVNIQSADTIMPSTNYALARYETEFTMPDHDATVTAVAKYDPDLPGLPGELRHSARSEMLPREQDAGLQRVERCSIRRPGVRHTDETVHSHQQGRCREACGGTSRDDASASDGDRHDERDRGRVQLTAEHKGDQPPQTCLRRGNAPEAFLWAKKEPGRGAVRFSGGVKRMKHQSRLT